ncbi:hypothetical protein [Sphingobium mellinum]|uniref:hypothetical protein n=1 Tax=Sphingobium mellinum TaxID=1387166 RepID=UPI003BF5FFB9
MAFRDERQSAWFDGMEAAFRHFGGVTEKVLLDNTAALITRHDAVTREVVFNDRLHAFTLLGLPTAGVCAISSAHEGQG